MQKGGGTNERASREEGEGGLVHAATGTTTTATPLKSISLSPEAEAEAEAAVPLKGGRGQKR